MKLRSAKNQFLNRATFGPTESSIAHLKNVGYKAWISAQLLLPPTFMLNETRKQNPPRWGEHVNCWLKVATRADDQLRQRVAYALSQFFVVSDQGCLGGQQAALSNYYDILIANSFGNFRELVPIQKQGVTRLTHVREISSTTCGRLVIDK